MLTYFMFDKPRTTVLVEASVVIENDLILKV